MHVCCIVNYLQGDKVEANARFLSTSQWCDEAASTLTLLGGLSLLHISRDAVHLKLGTAYPVRAVSGPDPGPCATGDHELSINLQPGGGSGSWVFTCAWCGVCQGAELLSAAAVVGVRAPACLACCISTLRTCLAHLSGCLPAFLPARSQQRAADPS
jgi:hypothetical protein